MWDRARFSKSLMASRYESKCDDSRCNVNALISVIVYQQLLLNIDAKAFCQWKNSRSKYHLVYGRSGELKVVQCVHFLFSFWFMSWLNICYWECESTKDHVIWSPVLTNQSYNSNSKGGPRCYACCFVDIIKWVSLLVGVVHGARLRYVKSTPQPAITLTYCTYNHHI